MPASVARRHRRASAGRRWPRGRGEQVHPQRPVRRRHPPQRHHPRGAVRRRRPAGRVGGQPGPPRRRRRRGARVDAGRRHRDLRRRACASRRCVLTDEVRRVLLRQLAHAGRARRRPRRPGRRQRASASSGSRALADAPARRGARLRRAPHAGRAGRPARRHRGASPTCSTRSARRPTSRSRPTCGSSVTRRRATHVTLRLHRAPTRSARGNVNAVEAVTVSAVVVRAALRRSTRRCRPTAARCARSACVATAGHDRRRARRPRRWAPATSR